MGGAASYCPCINQTVHWIPLSCSLNDLADWLVKYGAERRASFEGIAFILFHFEFLHMCLFYTCSAWFSYYTILLFKIVSYFLGDALSFSCTLRLGIWDLVRFNQGSFLNWLGFLPMRNNFFGILSWLQNTVLRKGNEPPN